MTNVGLTVAFRTNAKPASLKRVLGDTVDLSGLETGHCFTRLSNDSETNKGKSLGVISVTVAWWRAVCSRKRQKRFSSFLILILGRYGVTGAQCGDENAKSTVLIQ